jgi:hypothetical protein
MLNPHRIRLLLAAGTLIALVLAARPALAIDWTTTIVGPGVEYANDVRPTSDGGYVVVGVGSLVNFEDYLVVKLGADGSEIWRVDANLSNYAERAFDVIETTDRGFIVVGSADNATGDHQWRLWLVKLTAGGDIEWTTENGLTQEIAVDSGIVRGTLLTDGRIALAGGSNSLSDVQDPWTAIVSPDGELQTFTAFETLGTPGFGVATYVHNITPLAGGGFALTGYVSSGLSNGYLWVFDADGQPLWDRVYTDFAVDFRAGLDVCATDDGGFALIGIDLPNANSTTVVKTDSLGAVEWSHTYSDASDYVNGYSIIQMANGRLLAAQSRFGAFGTSRFTAELLEIDTDGALLDRQQLPGGSYSTRIQQLRALDGGTAWVAAGFRRDTGDVQNLDAYVLRGQYGGNSTAGLEDAGGAPFAGALVLAPNPSAGRLALAFPGATLQRVQVYDVHGRLRHDVRALGGARFELDLPALPSGVYYLRAQTSAGERRASFSLQR